MSDDAFDIDFTALEPSEYLDYVGGIYEHSPWIAEAALQSPGDIGTVGGLHAAMKTAVECADDEAKLALLCAHPELACAPAEASSLTAESQSEQAGAGLQHCTPEEFAEFQRLNKAYMEKFGFPFIIAVKGLDRQEILEAFRKRIENDRDTEFDTAIEQVHKIARLRLQALRDRLNGDAS